MATPTEQVTTNIPEWLKAPMQRLVATAEAQMGLGYQPYVETDAQGNPIIDQATGLPRMRQRVAEFSPLQMQAFRNIAGMQTADQIRQATGMAGLAGLDARDLARYAPATERQFYDAPSFRELGTGFERVNAPGATQYQMGPYERVGAERFGLGAMQEYMSPYMQGVVERQKQAAVRDFARQIPGLQAAGIRSGGRGGTREALLQAEAQRGLQERLGDIEATGLQQAYQQAASQFGQDRAAQIQTALANQAAGMQTGQTNLQALINQAQFGAGQGLQAQQLNQAAQLQAQQQAMQQLLALNQFNQQNAASRAQYGLAGANLAEQSRQFGAGLGLQGIQQQLAAAGVLGGLGQQQYQQLMGMNAAQLGAGGQQQALNQELLNTQYQDFLNAQRFPYQQAEFMSGILRGLPATGQTQTMYQQPGSLFGQIAGIGLGLGSLFGGFGSNTQPPR